MESTEAAAHVYPILLDKVIVSAKVHVGLSTVGSSIGRPKGPGALIRVFRALTVKPGVEIRIAGGLFQFMGHNGQHTIRSGIAIGPNRLRFARTGAAIRVAYKCELDVEPGDGSVRMPAAILGAKT